MTVPPLANLYPFRAYYFACSHFSVVLLRRKGWDRRGRCRESRISLDICVCGSTYILLVVRDRMKTSEIEPVVTSVCLRQDPLPTTTGTHAEAVVQ